MISHSEERRILYMFLSSSFLSFILRNIIVSSIRIQNGLLSSDLYLFKMQPYILFLRKRPISEADDYNCKKYTKDNPRL
jgi:hypothetical protein